MSTASTPAPLTIWVDADACPGPVRDIILRAAERLRLPIVFVAGKTLAAPRSPYVRVVRVAAGPDAADSHIVKASAPGDVAVTADIPLAALLVPKGVVAIDPRGALYSEENIRERLSIRDFMQGVRDAGVVTGGPRPFDAKAKQRFAATLDATLTRLLREPSPRTS